MLDAAINMRAVIGVILVQGAVYSLDRQKREQRTAEKKSAPLSRYKTE
jgi:hypothetical protein